VLDLAVTALNEHGISGFTTRRVAELAGTSVPSSTRSSVLGSSASTASRTSRSVSTVA